MVFSSLAASCCCYAENLLIPAVQIPAAASDWAGAVSDAAGHELKATADFADVVGGTGELLEGLSAKGIFVSARPRR